MARIRTLKPEFFRSRSLSRVDPLARLTFAGLWCEADDAGRGVADPRILKGAIWPLDDHITADEISRHLQDLADTGHILIYADDDSLLYQVLKWEKHQASSYRTGKSKHPDPPDGAQSIPVAESDPRLSTTSREIPRGVVLYGSGGDGSRGEGISAPDSNEKLAADIARWRNPGASRQEETIASAVDHELGEALTDTEQTNRARTIKELGQAHATPPQVHERCAEYRRRFQNMPLTDAALRKHWSSLAEAQVLAPNLNASSQALVKAAQRRGLSA